MTVYYMENYKQKKVSKGRIPVKKTGLANSLTSKPKFKVCLPIVMAGLVYTFFVGFASILVQVSQ